MMAPIPLLANVLAEPNVGLFFDQIKLTPPTRRLQTPRMRIPQQAHRPSCEWK